MRTLRWLLAVLLCLGWSTAATAQTPTGDGPITKDTSVGYIDSAVPQSQVRWRYDSAYEFNRPSRAEFFYAKGQAAGGAGLPLPETRIDAQEASAYVEAMLRPRFSLFTEVPVRYLNPEINGNHAGLSDVSAGFKFAFWQNDAALATLLFRTVAPTGDAHAGLGTNHVSFEQGVLYNRKLGEWLTLEGETRVWVPVGGSEFAGTMLRYGVGLSFGPRADDGIWITPVVECVGWTALGGREQEEDGAIVSARGDTIINGKAGVRIGVGRHFDLYAGYGRALTGEVWYKDVVRVEARWKF